MRNFITLGLLLTTSYLPLIHAAVKLPSIFSKHMVLQQGESAPIWGQASPGEQVTVSIAHQQAETVANADGHWRIELPQLGLDEGPHVLVVEGTNRLEIEDVVLGEVWLCSGQSNMDFQVSKSIGAQEEIKLPENRRLRQFKVTGPISEFPQKDCHGRWIIADPKTVGNFSGVAYYFGKKISTELGQNVGLINASVGGTAIEAWTSLEALSQSPQLKESAEKYHNEHWKIFPRKLKQFSNDWTTWVKTNQREVVEPTNLEPYLSADSSGWDSVELPGPILNSKLPQAGVIWLRRTVEIEDSNASQRWGLELGDTTGLCEIYWNGHKIRTETVIDLTKQKSPLRASISNNWIKTGSNQLAIRMYQPKEGFAVGDIQRFRLSFHQSRQDLDGIWKVKVESALPALSPEARANYPEVPPQPKIRTASLAAAWFNTKIAPLIPYSLRGVIWYQGESNAGRAYQYREAFPLMIRDWRARWGLGDFPFYFAQLANYGAKTNEHPNSHWAQLREAQTLTLKLPNTGQAILTDLGESRDIHPRNKKDVGERLAAIALARDYGLNIEYEGPSYESMTIENSGIRLHFSNISESLVAHPVPENYIVQSRVNQTAPLIRHSPNSQLESFAICGEDRQWHWANASIEGTTVFVHSPDVPDPVAVRYNWESNPNGNLYNSAGFPAGPFRTDDFPLSTRDARY
ncbi:sialate O-acetylesterase [Coraliomargarita algicola]|uniref:Sialate O-acetylesterase n=1 Tax=Coraliomargarita algicola TaxID=3092156 RepID=A0ABZ0RPB7_9BACT|nr:sialate O-acetylesterase [Coraliomargarita sp. J2-16]WPJ96742.1 sialate O-acetylesterase [Coraliomargarita sp. J2-16]